MSGRLRVATRELASLKREKTIVLAILIQLVVAGFSSFLLVGLVSMYDPGAVAGGETEIGVAGEAGEELVSAIEGDGGWELAAYESPSAAQSAFAAGRVDAVFVARPDTGGRVDVTVLVPDSSVRSTVIVVSVREALQALERARRDALSASLERTPLPLPDVPRTPPTVTFTYTVLLPLLVVLPAFISGSIAADTITEEIDRGTLELLLVSPLSGAEIVDGKMLATIALAPVQTAAWLGLLWLNGTAIASPVSIVALVAALATLLVVLGVWLALVFEERQAAQLSYSLLVLVGFGLATLLPESPPNTVAKLAIGSADPLTFGHVTLYLALAGASYVFVRRVAARGLKVQ